MTMPVWMLLGFATWTLLLLVFTVGTYRWSLILTSRAQVAGFPADGSGGAEWYQRATRAHANCIENLPVFGAIVFALTLSGVRSPVADALSVAVLAARVAQSVVHVSVVQGNAAVSVRFSFFCVQAVAFLGLVAMIMRTAFSAN